MLIIFRLGLFLFHLAKERHLFASSAIAQNLRFKSELVGLLRPLDRVQFSVELLAPVRVSLVMQLLPCVDGLFSVALLCLVVAWWFFRVDLWLEGKLGVSLEFKVFLSGLLELTLLVLLPFLKDKINSLCAVGLSSVCEALVR